MVIYIYIYKVRFILRDARLKKYYFYSLNLEYFHFTLSLYITFFLFLSLFFYTFFFLYTFYFSKNSYKENNVKCEFISQGYPLSRKKKKEKNVANLMKFSWQPTNFSQFAKRRNMYFLAIKKQEAKIIFALKKLKKIFLYKFNILI